MTLLQALKRLLIDERGSAGTLTALAGAALTAGAGAAASAGVNELLTDDPEKAKLIDPITGEELAADRTASVGALGQQAGFANQLQGAGQQGVGAQQSLLAALQLQAAGGGPNPAAQALANATGANVANQAALMAGQRGAGANAGLVGRNAAMQGAAIQQQAAGQGALMQQQQQLNAQGLLAQQANQQVGQQGQAIGNLNTAAQGLQGLGLNAAANRNSAENAAVGSVNSAMSDSNAEGAKAAADVMRGGLGAAGNMVVQGQIDAANQNKTVDMTQSKTGVPFARLAKGGEVAGDESKLKPGDHEDNDIVPVLLSPGEIVIPRSYASDPKAAAAFAHACALFANKKDSK